MRTDQELAAIIREWKGVLNPDTGKPFGLRLIADQEGISYGRARYIDTKYNRPDDLDSEFLGDTVRTFTPVRSFVWDLETTNLNTFMGQLTVASFLDLADGSIDTRTLFDFEGTGPEKEVALLLWVVKKMGDADILIGHNTLGFDTGFLRGRLAIHGLGSTVQLPRRQHWDTYQIARHGFKGKPQGYSLENLLDFFRVPMQKDKPSKHDWAASIILDEEAIQRIAERCKADVTANALLWEHLRPYFHLWKGR